MFFDYFPGSGYICAHRGVRSLAPENTMLAIELCLEYGADFWELDVHKSVDGALVVFHDDVLDRTTDVADRPEFADRAPWKTHEFTLEELRSLDAGSWFLSSDPFETIAADEIPQAVLDQIPGQRIPTLEEALAFARRHEMPVNIEIKDQVLAPDDLSIVADVLDMVRALGMDEMVLISSFKHEYLAEMHRLAPELPLAALVEEEHPENTPEYVRSLGAVGYHPDEIITEPELARKLVGQGMRVSPFTVNDMDKASAFVEAGCFGVITDFPHRLRQRLGR